MNNVHQLKPYEAPLVELIEVEVENGFAASQTETFSTDEEGEW